MSLKVEDFQRIVEGIAPNYLIEDYDNVGLMTGDRESEVTSVLAALDCTIPVILEAIDKNCNLIFTHHPLLFLKPSCVTVDTLIGKKLQMLIKNEISVFSCHTNLDNAEGGISDCFSKLLGFNKWEVMEKIGGCCSEKLKEVGAGRLVYLEETIPFNSFCKLIKDKLGIPVLRCCGDLSKPIKKIALLNGSGEDYFSLAKKNEVDCIVTGDTKYHLVNDYIEMGFAIIDAGHFETEWPAFRLFLGDLNCRLHESGFKNEIIESRECRSPYKYM